MQCPRCRAENREGRRFCGECGLSLDCGMLGLRVPEREAARSSAVDAEGPLASPLAAAGPKFQSPRAYTPKHLAEKILALEKRAGR